MPPTVRLRLPSLVSIPPSRSTCSAFSQRASASSTPRTFTTPFSRLRGSASVSPSCWAIVLTASFLSMGLSVGRLRTGVNRLGLSGQPVLGVALGSLYDMASIRLGGGDEDKPTQHLL